MKHMTLEDVSLGTDIVEIERIRSLVDKFGSTFLHKIFNEDEISYCQKTANSASSFAARFATKEAFSKALGTGIGNSIGWKDISVGRKTSGEPYLIISEKAADSMKKFGFIRAKVSLSHTKTLAQAVVVLIK